MARAPLRRTLLLSLTLVFLPPLAAEPITQRTPANGVIAARRSPTDPLSTARTPAPTTRSFDPPAALKLSLVETPDAAVSIKCDGVNDDAPAINAALAKFSYIKPLGNQTLRLQGPVCAIGSTINAPKWSGITFEGNGAGTNGRSATTLSWIGSAGGVMLDLTSLDDDSLTAGMQMSGINLEGNNVAGTGILIRGMNYTHLGFVEVQHTTMVGVDIDSNNSSNKTNTQLNKFDGFSIFQTLASAKGLVIGRGAGIDHTAGDNADVTDNIFGIIYVLSIGGDGVECGASDGNVFQHIRSQGPQGSGTLGNGPFVALRLEGTRVAGDRGFDSCRYNKFESVQSVGRIVAENGVAQRGVNTAPAIYNTLEHVGVGDSFILLDLTNGAGGTPTQSLAVGNGADATNNNLIETDQGVTTGVKSMTATGRMQGGKVVAKGGGAELTTFDRAQNGGSFNVYKQSLITHLSDSGQGAAADIPSLGVRAHDQLTLGGATVTSPVLFQAPAGVTFPIVLGNPQPPPRGSPGVYFTARVGNTCQLSVIVSGGAVTGLASSYACP